MHAFSPPFTSMRRLTTALVFCTSLTLASLAMPHASHAADPAMEFLNNGYNFCDAKLLASFWGNSTDQAKVAAGQKLINMKKQKAKIAINETLANARGSGASCEFMDTGYTYEQAELLAKYWGRSVGDAKTKIAQFFTDGQSRAVKKALAEAGG